MDEIQALEAPQPVDSTDHDRGSVCSTMSDPGGYALLVSACAQSLLYLEGKQDWQVHGVPEIPGP